MADDDGAMEGLPLAPPSSVPERKGLHEEWDDPTHVHGTNVIHGPTVNVQGTFKYFKNHEYHPEYRGRDGLYYLVSPDPTTVPSDATVESVPPSTGTITPEYEAILERHLSNGELKGMDTKASIAVMKAHIRDEFDHFLREGEERVAVVYWKPAQYEVGTQRAKTPGVYLYKWRNNYFHWNEEGTPRWYWFMRMDDKVISYQLSQHFSQASSKMWAQKYLNEFVTKCKIVYMAVEGPGHPTLVSCRQNAPSKEDQLTHPVTFSKFSAPPYKGFIRNHEEGGELAHITFRAAHEWYTTAMKMLFAQVLRQKMPPGYHNVAKGFARRMNDLPLLPQDLRFVELKQPRADREFTLTQIRQAIKWWRGRQREYEEEIDFREASNSSWSSNTREGLKKRITSCQREVRKLEGTRDVLKSLHQKYR